LPGVGEFGQPGFEAGRQVSIDGRAALGVAACGFGARLGRFAGHTGSVLTAEA